MTATQVDDFIQRFITATEKVVDSGFPVTTLCIEGPAGIGKTSIIKQAAQRCGYDFIKRNLGEAEDLGALFGYPIVQYLITKDGDEKWVPKELLEPLIKAGFKFTDKTKMSFSSPDWVPLDPESKGILLLDDFTRALPIFMQATMTLVDEMGYGDWKLPKGWIVMLSTNPDSGEYSVASLDPAQKTRFLTIKMDGSAKDWAIWAEEVGMDNRTINFVLANEEMFIQSSGKEVSKSSDLNFRILTKFLQNIGTIEDFNSNLDYINTLAEDSFGESFAALFTRFIVQGLDKLPKIEDVFKAKDGIQQLIEATGDYTNGSYNNSTAGILAIRLINFANGHNGHNDWNQKMNEIMKNIVCSGAFDVDLKMFIIRQTIMGKNNILRLYLPTHHEIKKFIVNDNTKV